MNLKLRQILFLLNVNAPLYVLSVDEGLLAVKIVIIRVVDSFVLVLLVLYLINCQVYDFKDVVSLQRERDSVSNGILIVKLNGNFIVLESFNNFFNQLKVIRSTDVVFKFVVNHILYEVKFKYSEL